jgi:uncharacterized protein YdaU (DUF1376 family)
MKRGAISTWRSDSAPIYAWLGAKYEVQVVYSSPQPIPYDHQTCRIKARTLLLQAASSLLANSFFSMMLISLDLAHHSRSRLDRAVKLSRDQS